MAADEGFGVQCTGVDGFCDGPSVGSFVVFEFLEELFGNALGHE